MSHPARGAWIEILSRRLDGLYGIGRTPQGVRGLKFISLSATEYA